MGSSHSVEKKSENKKDDQQKLDDAHKIFDITSEKTLDSDDLKITETEKEVKEKLKDHTSEKEQNSKSKTSDTLGDLTLSSEIDNHQKGGNNFENISRNRYSKYDVYSTIQKVEKKFIGGFNSQAHSEIDDNESEKDDKTTKHIKDIILQELDNLNKHNFNQIGAGCDCNKKEESEESEESEETKKTDSTDKIDQKGGRPFISSSSSSSFSTSSESDSSDIKKNKKFKNNTNYKQSRSKSNKNNKKSKKNKKESSESESEEFEGNLKIQSDSEIMTSNNSNTEEGLSIFPFNSSDIKSNVSDRHQKILRRKI